MVRTDKAGSQAAAANEAAMDELNMDLFFEGGDDAESMFFGNDLLDLGDIGDLAGGDIPGTGDTKENSNGGGGSGGGVSGGVSGGRKADSEVKKNTDSSSNLMDGMEFEGLKAEVIEADEIRNKEKEDLERKDREATTVTAAGTSRKTKSKKKNKASNKNSVPDTISDASSISSSSSASEFKWKDNGNLSMDISATDDSIPPVRVKKKNKGRTDKKDRKKKAKMTIEDSSIPTKPVRTKRNSSKGSTSNKTKVHAQNVPSSPATSTSSFTLPSSPSASGNRPSDTHSSTNNHLVSSLQNAITSSSGTMPYRKTSKYTRTSKRRSPTSDRAAIRFASSPSNIISNAKRTQTPSTSSVSSPSSNKHKLREATVKSSPGSTDQSLHSKSNDMPRMPPPRTKTSNSSSIPGTFQRRKKSATAGMAPQAQALAQGQVDDTVLGHATDSRHQPKHKQQRKNAIQEQQEQYKLETTQSLIHLNNRIKSANAQNPSNVRDIFNTTKSGNLTAPSTIPNITQPDRAISEQIHQQEQLQQQLLLDRPSSPQLSQTSSTGKTAAPRNSTARAIQRIMEKVNLITKSDFGLQPSNLFYPFMPLPSQVALKRSLKMFQHLDTICSMSCLTSFQDDPKGSAAFGMANSNTGTSNTMSFDNALNSDLLSNGNAMNTNRNRNKTSMNANASNGKNDQKQETKNLLMDIFIKYIGIDNDVPLPIQPHPTSTNANLNQHKFSHHGANLESLATATGVVSEINRDELQLELYCALALVHRQAHFLRQSLANMKNWCQNNFRECNFNSIYQNQTLDSQNGETLDRNRFVSRKGSPTLNSAIALAHAVGDDYDELLKTINMPSFSGVKSKIDIGNLDGTDIAFGTNAGVSMTDSIDKAVVGVPAITMPKLVTVKVKCEGFQEPNTTSVSSGKKGLLVAQMPFLPGSTKMDGSDNRTHLGTMAKSTSSTNICVGVGVAPSSPSSLGASFSSSTTTLTPGSASTKNFKAGSTSRKRRLPSSGVDTKASKVISSSGSGSGAKSSQTDKGRVPTKPFGKMNPKERRRHVAKTLSANALNLERQLLKSKKTRERILRKREEKRNEIIQKNSMMLPSTATFWNVMKQMPYLSEISEKDITEELSVLWQPELPDREMYWGELPTPRISVVKVCETSSKELDSDALEPVNSSSSSLFDRLQSLLIERDDSDTEDQDENDSSTVFERNGMTSGTTKMIDVSNLSLDQRAYIQLRAVHLIDQPLLPSSLPNVVEEVKSSTEDETNTSIPQRNDSPNLDSDDDIDTIIRRMQMDLSEKHKNNNSTTAFLQTAAKSFIAEEACKKYIEEENAVLITKHNQLVKKQNETRRVKKPKIDSDWMPW